MEIKPPPLVLVVDDDVTTARILENLIRKASLQPVCAYDVAGAWTAISSRRPDLILLDIHLPDGNGLEFCQKLQSTQGISGIPVLFISAIDDVSSKLRGFEVGGVDYITKPLAGAEVLARVTTHLRLKQAYERLAELQAERIEKLAASQKALMPLPADLPAARFQIYSRQVLEAGGDFYDVIPIGQDATDYVVADASGHDLGTSVWTASLKALLSEYATPLNSPREVLVAVNKALVKILPPGMYFTLIYARLNRQTGQLTLVNAGHPPALVAAGDELEIKEQTGDPVGVFGDADFGVASLSLRPGDRFFLYSDGIIELAGSREVGTKGLISACQARQPAALDEMVKEVVVQLTMDHAVQDDIVLMGVEV